MNDAVSADPALGGQLRQALGSGTPDLSDTSFIQRLPEALAMPFKVGFSHSIDVVFLIAAVVVALGFVVLWFLPELPLRNQSGIQAAQAEAAAAAGDPDDAGDQATRAVGVSAPTSTAAAGRQAGRRAGVAARCTAVAPTRHRVGATGASAPGRCRTARRPAGSGAGGAARS